MNNESAGKDALLGFLRETKGKAEQGLFDLENTKAEWVQDVGKLIDRLESYLASARRSVCSRSLDARKRLERTGSGPTPFQYCESLRRIAGLWRCYRALGTSWAGRAEWMSVLGPRRRC